MNTELCLSLYILLSNSIREALKTKSRGRGGQTLFPLFFKRCLKWPNSSWKSIKNWGWLCGGGVKSIFGFIRGKIPPFIFCCEMPRKVVKTFPHWRGSDQSVENSTFLKFVSSKASLRYGFSFISTLNKTIGLISYCLII